MKVPALASPDRPGPRRRNSETHRRIREATVAILEEGGYGSLTIEGVAARARVGKQTIYRWWPNKATLVMESFIVAGEERVAEPDTGAVVGDLEAILIPVFRQNSNVTQGTAKANKGMMAEAQLDRAFFEVYAQLHASWWGPLERALQRGIDRGELAQDTDIQAAIDAMLGASWYRVLLEHAPLDDAFARLLVRMVVAANGTNDRGDAAAAPAIQG